MRAKSVPDGVCAEAGRESVVDLHHRESPMKAIAKPGPDGAAARWRYRDSARQERPPTSKRAISKFRLYVAQGSRRPDRLPQSWLCHAERHQHADCALHDRDELCSEACRIAVVEGGFRTSLINIADRRAMTIVPVASAGKYQDLLTGIKDLLSSASVICSIPRP